MLKLTCLLFFLVLGHASAAGDPHFAVASIHPQAAGDNRLFVRPPSNGRLSATGATARLLVMLAWDVQESQIAGGPDWLGSDKWDIEAKSDDGAAHSVEETRRMLQALLETRFALRVHRETQQRPAYVLTVAKGGPRFQPSSETGSQDIRVGARSIAIRHAKLDRMTQVLGGVLGRPVVDRTGLSGNYDISLQWDEAPFAGGGVPGLAATAAPGTDHGSIFSAIEEQLGLHLTSGRVPVGMIAIDGAAKPSGN